jgi:hypothetical protein
MEILAAFDFKRVPVDVVLVECSKHVSELERVMQLRGFVKRPRIHGDFVFVSRMARDVCSDAAPRV